MAQKLVVALLLTALLGIPASACMQAPTAESAHVCCKRMAKQCQSMSSESS